MTPKTAEPFATTAVHVGCVKAASELHLPVQKRENRDTSVKGKCMAEATSRSYASACYIGRKPNVVSAVLGNNCGAWAESLAIRQLWQAEKKESA